MFGKDSIEGFTEILPGIQIKTLVHGGTTLMTKFLLSKGSILPSHHHPYEQTGYLVTGRIRLRIGDRVCEMDENASWCIEANAEHSAEVLENSVALEIFSPARPDYLQFFSVEDTL